jgi:hypothetical protein
LGLDFLRVPCALAIVQDNAVAALDLLEIIAQIVADNDAIGIQLVCR